MANSPSASKTRAVSNSLSGAKARGGDSFEKVSWSRPALLRGDGKGNEPLGKTNWAVWWWLAPLLFLIFGIIALLWAISHIEGAIESSSAEILADAGIPTEGLEFEADYRDVEVSGAIPAGFTATQIEEALEADDSRAFNVRNATIAAAAAAIPDPVSLAVDATSDGETLTLTGTVPTQENKDELIAAAEATGLTVDDRLTVAGGEAASVDPDGQIGAMSAVVGTLAAGSFTSAALSIGDDGPVSGDIIAADAAAATGFESLATDTLTVSAPATLGAINTEVNYDGERIVLDGTVLSNDQSAALESAATDVVGAENVVNNLRVSGLEEEVDGADGRVGALAAAVATFGGLDSADAMLDDSDLTVNGVASDEAGQAATNAAIDSADGAGLRPGGQVTLPETTEVPVEEQIDLLQAELDALQDEIRENVVFDTNTNALTPAATETLDKVVAAMNLYPLPVVEIGGHTDDRGSNELNNGLSQSRADAVAEYVSGQVDPGRLSAVGFGESQPIADNNTPEGQAQNRRVEFIAKESF